MHCVVVNSYCWRGDFVSRETNGRCQLEAAGEFCSAFPDNLLHYRLYLEESFHLSNFKMSGFKCFPHWVSLWADKFSSEQDKLLYHTLKNVQQWGFLSASTSIREEGGVGLSITMGRKVRFSKQQGRLSDRTAFSVARTLIIEMFTASPLL